MKNVVLIGASGFVGSAILNELLSRDHKVTAVVRTPEKITTKHDNLEVVKADVADTSKVAEISRGKNAVISAYNPGWQNDNIYEDTLKVYPAILEGVKKAGVKHFLVVGGAGTLFVSPGVMLKDTGVLPEAIMPGVESLGKFYLENLSNEKELNWTFFSPAGLIEPGERTGKFRLGKDDLITDEEGNSKISVEDYAVAMVNELEDPKHSKERFTIGY